MLQPHTPWSRRRRLWLLLALPLLWWGAGAASALIATQPAPASIPPRTELGGHAVLDVTVQTSDGLSVRGWLARASPDSRRCAVLAAGIHGNRCAMLARAEWYLAHGWSALLVDLRGTGASDSARASMGWHEAKDLLAWRLWLRSEGFSQIGAHGQSLGAAAVVYCAALASSDQGFDFTVLESCYGDIDSALHHRLPWVPWPRLLLWPLRFCGEWCMRVDADSLRPLDAIASLRAPTLIACGDQDDKVGAGVSAALLHACGATHKQLVLVHGIGHQDLWADTTLRNALAAFLASM
jgi:pimeloyl-ACP methyl ester carboxylesterase